ncbi:double zinc ribbon domain-containing protein [Bacillus licheniformis]|nr:double zinc ribbon domain-containing protein [Bacillus licheniformis]
MCSASLHSLSWHSFSFTIRREICRECKENFIEIKGTVCPKCGRPQGSEELCGDCANGRPIR